MCGSNRWCGRPCVMAPVTKVPVTKVLGTFVTNPESAAAIAKLEAGAKVEWEEVSPLRRWGRPPKGDKPMTGAERVRKHRERKP